MVPGLTPVPYVDETGANATATEYTQIEPTAANWTGGLYVVKGNVTTPGNVTVSGAMPGIILCDGASLTAQGGITLPDGSPVPLTIYGQTGGTGTMTVTNQSGAAAMTDETYGTAPGTPSLAGRTGDSSAPVTWYYSARRRSGRTSARIFWMPGPIPSMPSSARRKITAPLPPRPSPSG